ncbi:retrovirus-related pol polyprotein from transposon TNT 1-94 [Tanacetum coccineum]
MGCMIRAKLEVNTARLKKLVLLAEVSTASRVSTASILPSVRTNPIIASQPNVITKKVVNSDSNGFSSIGVDITNKTRRPQPRSNTKNDRVPSASKSSRIKNKEVEVEEHHRNLLLSKNKKHMSSECNKIKLAIHNDKYEVVCVMCKQCLITANHDVCMLDYVNGMNSRRFTERLASSKPSKPRMCLRWSPTGKMFGIKGILIASSESNGDNACYPNMFMFLGTVYFGNDHVAAILSFDDLQWGNILITRVYFVEGLGHNLFSVGKFCDSDLEVAFRRNTEYLLSLIVASKSKRASHPHKPVPNSKQRLHLLHMDLCGPMRIASINGKCVGISHQASSVLTPQQNGVVEQRNRTLVETARKMLIFSRAPLFLWVEAIANACYTQNSFIILRRFDKTPYDLINGRKPDISFLHVFGALYYPKNDREDIGKLGAKGDIGFFIGYSANSCAYKVYNQRTKKIIETMNISSGLDLTYALSTITTQQPTEVELDLLFEAMYDDYIGGEPSATPRTFLAAQAPQVLQTPTATTTTTDTTLTLTNSSSQATNFPNTSQDVDELETQQHVHHQPATITDNVLNAMFDDNKFVNPFATPSTSVVESSSSQYADPSNMHTFYKLYPHGY